MKIDIKRMLDISHKLSELPNEADREILNAIHILFGIDYIETLSEDRHNIHPVIQKEMVHAKAPALGVLRKYKGNPRYTNLIDYVETCLDVRDTNIHDVEKLITSLFTIAQNERRFLSDFLNPNFIKPYFLTLVKQPYKGMCTLPYIAWYPGGINLYFQVFNFNSTLSIDRNSDMTIAQYNSISDFQKLFLSSSFDIHNFDLFIEKLSKFYVPRRDMFLSTGSLANKTVRTYMNYSVFRRHLHEGKPGNFIKFISQTNQFEDLLMLMNKNTMTSFLYCVYSRFSLSDLRKSVLFPLFAVYTGTDVKAIKYVLGFTTIENQTAFNKTWIFSTIATESVGLEAIDDTDAGDDEDEDTEDIEEDVPEEDEGEEPEEDEPEEDETEEESTEDGNNIDEEDETEALTSNLDKLFLTTLTIEMADDEETLDDLLYKRSVCSLINSYYKNPPEDITSEELLLLRYWCNNWIYFVSVKTTKELLSTIIGE